MRKIIENQLKIFCFGIVAIKTAFLIPKKVEKKPLLTITVIRENKK